jgi:hypothetical protein
VKKCHDAFSNRSVSFGKRLRLGAIVTGDVLLHQRKMDRPGQLIKISATPVRSRRISHLATAKVWCVYPLWIESNISRQGYPTAETGGKPAFLSYLRTSDRTVRRGTWHVNVAFQFAIVRNRKGPSRPESRLGTGCSAR